MRWVNGYCVLAFLCQALFVIIALLRGAVVKHDNSLSVAIIRWPWLIPSKRFAGYCLPGVIVMRPLQSHKVYLHESRHDQQWQKLGVLFLPAYLLGLIGYGYHNNPFECDARDYAERNG